MPSIRRIRRRRITRNILLVMAFLLLGVGVVVGLQTDFWKGINQFWISSDDDAPETIEPESPAEVPSEFEEFLARASLQQLILRSTELTDDSDDDLDERLEKQQQKLQIAELVLEKGKDSRSKDFGVSSKLRALRKREMIRLDHGLTEQQGIEQLKDFSLDHINSRDSNILREARLGRLLTQLLHKIVLSDRDAPASSHDLTIQEFGSIAQAYEDDSEVALELVEILKRIHVGTSDKIYQKYLTRFKQVYGKSQRQQLKDLADEAAVRIGRSEFSFADVVGTSGVRKQEQVRLLESQIEEGLGRPSVSQAGLVQLAAALRQLARSGSYESALKLADDMQRRIADRDPLKPLAGQLRKYRLLLRQVGQSFDFTGIETMQGQPFEQSNDNAPVKAILLTNAGSFEASRDAVGFILKSVGSDAANNQFNFSLLLIDNGKDSAALTELKRLSRLTKAVNIGRINSDSEAGKAVLERIGVISVPLLILLDDQNVVRGIDINVKDFPVRYQELLGK